MSRQDAARNRDRVITTASRMFREDGYDGVGIAALMQAAGLTNGAFYKQFESKEALIAEATAHALSRNAEAWKAVLDSAGGDPLEAIAQWYLSAPHVQHRGLGCTFATLAAEAPRHDPPLRQVFDTGLRTAIRQIVAAGQNPDDPDREAKAIRLLSRLVGALTLARATSDPELAARILSANGATDATG
ncbi:TetR/AcrR family transcriptional regulator [Pseudodonghicola flavimaris]|uniref:TetR/AcrR family transcriptional regulator n=1 Tax=Pseudodonghicola flavimaris TaxID=3050036 RepID=A0ABT7EVX2_9RHOB|nr:TetR/AcrR family transcriptional regulator [Pseudodonghicola flavimaris]MDK3016486.1 TetR/AcrR family transcriptional regulator [Pseudodonghicola flavimaris]